MSATTRCPSCGRKLSFTSPDLMVCDGCEHTFDPLAPPSPASRDSTTTKRAFGMILLIFGGLTVVSGISVVRGFDFSEEQVIPRTVGVFIIPTICIVSGLALRSNKPKREARSSESVDL